MEKNHKMLLGVAVVGVGAYLLWKSKQPKKATFMKSANGCPAGSVAVKGTGADAGKTGCVSGLGSGNPKFTKRLNANGVKGLDVSGKLVNRRRMVGLNGVKGLDVSGKLVNRKRMVGMSGGKRMVGMINNDKVKAGPFGKKNLINSTDVQEGSFKTFTPENLGSDLLSVKNSNFFDQNILASKFS
jgi:hypothetical protein